MGELFQCEFRGKDHEMLLELVDGKIQLTATCLEDRE